MRRACVLAATLFLVILTAWVRPPTRESGQAEEVHWVQKTWWQGRFDVVAGGDSRVSESFAPAVIGKHLPGLRIGNFGFAVTSLTTEYLEALAATLDPSSPNPVVVLGVTPLAVTRVFPPPLNGFRHYHSMPWNQRLAIYYLGALQRPLAPIRTKRIRNFLRGQVEEGHRIYYPDGGIATAPIPERPNHAEGDFRYMFRKERAHPELIPALLLAVEGMVRRGLRVVAYRPPVPARMRALEAEFTDFDEARISAQLVAAGALWFTTDPERFHSYDGSHLRSDAGRDFSEQLGAFLAMKALGTP